MAGIWRWYIHFFRSAKQILYLEVGGKLFDISLDNPVGLFPNYDALVEYLLHEIGQYSLKVGRKDKREVHLMEQDVLLSAIAISWSNFNEKERKEFYHGLCDRHNKDLLSFRMPVESIRKGKSFKFDAFDKIYETGSTAFLKIAGLLVKATHSKLYDKDISLISDPAYEFWAGIFINKITDRLNRLPYGNSIVLALGCVAAAAFARQVEFFKREGISLDQIKAYEIAPESWTSDDKSLYRTQFIDGKSK